MIKGNGIIDMAPGRYVFQASGRAILYALAKYKEEVSRIDIIATLPPQGGKVRISNLFGTMEVVLSNQDTEWSVSKCWRNADREKQFDPSSPEKHEELMAENRAPTLHEMMRQMVREEFSGLAKEAGFESFEEAEDFDVEDADDYDPTSPYEMTEMVDLHTPDFEDMPSPEETSSDDPEASVSDENESHTTGQESS